MTAPRPFVGSYSAFAAYENCPKQFHARYIAKTLPYVETKEMKEGNDAHKALEQRLRVGTPLPERFYKYEMYAHAFELQRANAEQKLGITLEGKATGFFSDDVWVRGTADVAIVEGKRAAIFDYKTSKKPREDPKELRIQALLLKALYPQIEQVSAFYIWLNNGPRIGLNHDASDFRTTWGEIVGVMQSIQRAKEMDHFPPRESPLCAWCSLTSCAYNRSHERTA